LPWRLVGCKNRFCCLIARFLRVGSPHKKPPQRRIFTTQIHPYNYLLLMPADSPTLLPAEGVGRNLITPSAYAKLCGVSPSAIYQRKVRGAVMYESFTHSDGTSYCLIDVDAYPPVQKQPPGRHKKVVRRPVVAWRIDYQGVLAEPTEHAATLEVDPLSNFTALVPGYGATPQQAYADALDAASVRFVVANLPAQPALPQDSWLDFCAREGIDPNGAFISELPACLVVLHLRAV
jgi:hypothetical protein